VPVVAVCLNPAVDRVVVAPCAAGGGTIRAARVLDTAGGKATHAALVASRFGADVHLVGPLGGQRGLLFAALLRGIGLRVSSVPVGGETRETWTVVDPEVGDVLELIGPAPRLSPDEVEALRVLTVAVLASATDTLLAGSAPEGVGPELYAEIVAHARGRGGRILLDASGDALRAGLAARPHVACPNLEEACAVLGATPPEEPSAASMLEVAAGTQELGAESVVITAGERGALVLSADGEAWHAAAPRRRRVNAVGCGDAFLGALAAALAEGRPLPEAARLATGAAVDKLGRIHPAEVDPAAARALAREVELRRIR
jgi:tagatose 6-phosphate kinase